MCCVKHPGGWEYSKNLSYTFARFTAKAFVSTDPTPIILEASLACIISARHSRRGEGSSKPDAKGSSQDETYIVHCQSIAFDE